MMFYANCGSSKCRYRSNTSQIADQISAHSRRSNLQLGRFRMSCFGRQGCVEFTTKKIRNLCESPLAKTMSADVMDPALVTTCDEAVADVADIDERNHASIP